ncbi:hypothetical protein LN378_31690, partial [Enterobacter hormaechei subsp. steigerwaltii]|nr:hypothetical protein [Enterobacter hormaechei subsp. steigerwaltii]
MNIERRLTDKIGDAGKRLHTGRSRNDQVATDIRLWLRDQITVIQSLIQNLQTALPQLQKAAKAAAALDVLSTFSALAKERNFVRPEFADYPVIHIENGRHPV